MTKVRSVLSVLAFSLVPQIVQAADPVHLTVGYQPYDTISYSAVVIRGLDLLEEAPATRQHGGFPSRAARCDHRQRNAR